MNIVNINLTNKNYPINIGFDIFKKENIFYPLKVGKKSVLITNENIDPLWKNIVYDYLTKSGIKVSTIVIKDGEKYKNLNMVNSIITSLLHANHTRDTILIALGGGVIGDLTGFIASIYQRGVNFIQIPTTLLSQVDASIGGKTGVNHVLGKNMIGSFWQPVSVLIDVNTLNTLPKKQLIAGLSEVIKYAIIFDYEFFCWLENNIDNILKLDKKSLLYCITKCCKLKKKIIIEDEYDFGNRALLNFGHTFGHAIETHLGYNNILHGEAISIGMMIATHISEILGYLKHDQVLRIQNILQHTGLPIKNSKNMNISSYYSYIERDKKNIDGNITFILPISIGKAKIFKNINKQVICSAIEKC
ncbi:3-dehydroquinate synthase [Buchnera aphidicola (Mollitrichosiphum nigrofasciatum)]|uniref:3-dehydroquinate synthase n=1 Tax=Buchnera aphidicola TaxID=9 RepID=UPI0031B84F39